MPAKTKPKGKGKGLTKKVGPLPLYVYLIGVGIVVLYLYYRHRNSSGSTSDAGSQNQQVIPSGIVVPQQGGGGSTDSGGGNGGVVQSPVDFPTDYATQTDLANAIDAVNNNTAAAVAGITFPQPTVNITVPNQTVHRTTTKTKQAAKKHAVTQTKTKPATHKYYTYKKNVPLRAGQTLHFTRGKGYYAA